jgi:hypothetical protein
VFNRFTRFNRYAQFKPPSPLDVAQGGLSDPASAKGRISLWLTRGRMKEGVERLKPLELFEPKQNSIVA